MFSNFVHESTLEPDFLCAFKDVLRVYIYPQECAIRFWALGSEPNLSEREYACSQKEKY